MHFLLLSVSVVKQGPRASSSTILLMFLFIVPFVITQLPSTVFFFMWIWISAWEYLLSASRTSSSIFYKARQLTVNSLFLVYLRMPLFHLQFWNTEFLVDDLLWLQWLCCSTAFWITLVLMKRQLLMRSSCLWWFFF